MATAKVALSSVLTLVAVLGSIACGQGVPDSSAVTPVVVKVTSTPSPTPSATATPLPTATPAPTYTPYPTATPSPTATRPPALSDWRAWYENVDLADWPGVRPPSVCEAHRVDYWLMGVYMDQLADVYMQQMAAAWQNNNEPLRQALTDRYLADVDAGVEQYKRQTGWSEAQYQLCDGLYRAERYPYEVCGTYGSPAGRRVVNDPRHYEAVGYCIERGIPPFD